MTKASLVHTLYRKHGALTKSQAAGLVESILAILKQGIVRDERILLTNFGSFEVLARRKRRGRNPITGDVIQIRPRRTLVFRTARKLEDSLNPGER